MEIHQGTIDTKEKLEKELQAAKAELKEALSNEQASASAYVKAKAELDILRNPSDGRCMEIAALREEIKRTRGLLEEAEPFARHVAACENHDGSKFQELAESWLERAERGEK